MRGPFVHRAQLDGGRFDDSHCEFRSVRAANDTRRTAPRRLDDGIALLRQVSVATNRLRNDTKPQRHAVSVTKRAAASTAKNGGASHEQLSCADEARGRRHPGY